MARFYAKPPLERRGFASNPLHERRIFWPNMIAVKVGAILCRSPRTDRTVGTGKAGRMAGLSALPGGPLGHGMHSRRAGAGPLGEVPASVESLDGHPFSW